nr:hypothetical protein [Candidatus Cloacimonadota bacterium]
MQETTKLLQSYLHGKRLSNAIGSYLDYYQSLSCKKAIVRHLPPALMIEPTNICNLKCPLCPSGNGTLKRSRGMMSFSVFKNIVDQIANQIGMLILWNQGEPYLNPEFNRMVRYAADKMLYTMTSTNASLSMDHEKIVKSGLDKIIISMDGISEETYNNYRINGNYSLVLKNMERLVATRERLRSKTPYIVWQFIIMRHNESEITQVKQMARDIGVDKLDFKTVQIYRPEDIKFLPTDHKLSRYSFSENNFELRTRLLNRCRRIWTQPVINWDGEFSICCYDKDVSFKIGNINDESMDQLWHSHKLMKIRNTILKERASIEICRNCGEGIVQKIKV